MFYPLCKLHHDHLVQNIDGLKIALSHFPAILSIFRAPAKDRFFTSMMPIFSPNPMLDLLLESSHRDDSNKWSNIGFGKEITQEESIEVNFIGLILYPDY